MSEHLSLKRQRAEFAFAQLSPGLSSHTRAQAEEDFLTAERQARTAKLRAERMARERFDVKR